MESSSRDTCKRSASNESSAERSPKRTKTEKDEIRQEEEKQISELMNLILDVVVVLKAIPKETIHKAKGFIIESFQKDSTHKFSDVNLSEWENSCAYFLRYGLHGAGLTRYRALEALQNCEDLESTLQKPDLNIISLGGGPGNDVIGFCSVLNKYQIQNQLNITVIDSVREWSTYVNLGKLFITEGNYGNVSKLFQHNDVNLSFLQAKLPGSPTVDKKYFEILAEADIILIAKLFSILKYSEKKGIVESVYENMKHGAFILFIDSPFHDELWSDFEHMYLSKSGQEYNYVSMATNVNFKTYDSVTSKVRVAVLRKR